MKFKMAPFDLCELRDLAAQSLVWQLFAGGGAECA
jgi:hypothetical protein